MEFEKELESIWQRLTALENMVYRKETTPPQTTEEQIASTPTTGFEIKCSTCGGSDTVPFKPTPGYPVYCKKCYSARGGGFHG